MRRIFFILALLAVLFFLYRAFPYALDDEDTRMRALYLVLLLALLVGGRQALARSMPKMLRDTALWMGVFALLIFAYGFRDEFARNRFIAEILPSRVQVNGNGTLSIRASEGGHFYIEGELNGVPARFLIDTGASDIVLSPEDAKRAGFNPETLRYSRFYSTANGSGSGADVTIASLKVGTIALSHVPASVNKAWMPESLLGMSFLHRLSGFRVEGNTLILEP